MRHIALLALLLPACAGESDSADYPVPYTAQPMVERPVAPVAAPTAAPAAVPAAPPAASAAPPAPAPAPSCVAEPGIWTVELVASTPETVRDCGSGARVSRSLGASPVEAAMSEAECDLGRTVTDDGCSVLCTKTSVLDGVVTEMLISYESPTRLAGYAVMTGNGVRCEYDVTYTKS